MAHLQDCDEQLRNGPYLRLIVQASAGTGKSYLLKAICIWCLLNKVSFKSCAPTGIAAANLEVEGTGVAATTVHTLFGLGFELVSKLNWHKADDPDVAALIRMKLWLLDEASMVDDQFWKCITSILEAAQRGRRSAPHAAPDKLGQVHVLIFMDVKQLPPATCRPVFLASPGIATSFRFATLRENRRVVGGGEARQGEIEQYHRLLDDIAMCRATGAVRAFCIDAYGRGACVTAKNSDFEGSTSIFSKRKYRDLWNRFIVRRLARDCGHTLKVHGKCKARFARDCKWHPERHFQRIKSRNKPKALWTLQMAGDWAYDQTSRAKHLMRVMLLANVDVAHGFANGKLGRLMSWQPGSFPRGRKCFVHYPNLAARFVKESSKHKPELISQVDIVEVQPLPENLKGRDIKSVLVQLALIPAYALCIHKVQALTLPHDVRACWEGFFAHGSAYVSASRCTDPANFQLVGLPPKDLLDDVAARWLSLGLDVNDCMQAAVSVSGEWRYRPARDGRSRSAAVDVASRLERTWAAGRTIPIKHRTLEETLNPQPEMATVMEGFMEWVDRENANLHAGLPSHPFETPSGEHIFPDPESGSEWFLTDVQQRLKPEVRQRRATNAGNDDDGPDSDEDDAAQEEDDCEASHGSSGDSDTSGVTDLDDDKSDEPDELAPRECNSFSHAARRHEGAPLSFWNELGGDNLPFRDSGEDSAKSPSAPQQAPEPQAVNTAAAADRPSHAAKRRAVATDVPEETYVVHVDSVAALPNGLRRRAKAGIGIDVKQ